MIKEYQCGVDTNTPSLRGWHASCRAYIYVHNRCMPFKGSWVSNSALLFLQKAALRLLPSGFVGWHRSAGLGPMLVSDDDLGSRSTILPRPPPMALSSRGSRPRRLSLFFLPETFSLKEDDNLWGIASHRIDVPYLLQN